MISARSFLIDDRLVLGVFVIFVALFLSGTGCQSTEETYTDVELDWEIEPDPPSVGMATLNITMRDSTDNLISGAVVELEGNMSHPGMQPVFAMAEEVEPGRYSADVKFSMGGDWFFLVEATLPDDRVIERQIDINGVRSQ